MLLTFLNSNVIIHRYRRPPLRDGHLLYREEMHCDVVKI